MCIEQGELPRNRALRPQRGEMQAGQCRDDIQKAYFFLLYIVDI
jgi:hypothetical protein